MLTVSGGTRASRARQRLWHRHSLTWWLAWLVSAVSAYCSISPCFLLSFFFCLAPRCDLTYETTSSPCVAMDFVQTPTCSSPHYYPFLVNCVILVSVCFPLVDLYSFLCFHTRHPLSSLAESCARLSLIICLLTLPLDWSLVDYKCSGCI